jgi:hypothetical protein
VQTLRACSLSETEILKGAHFMTGYDTTIGKSNRNDALEEAAKIAEAWPDYHKECSTAEGEFDPDEAAAVFATASVIARKIRQLKS